MTMDRNALAHTLVRFYLAHGSVLPLLDTLTIREIHLTCELLGPGVKLGVELTACPFSSPALPPSPPPSPLLLSPRMSKCTLFAVHSGP